MGCTLMRRANRAVARGGMTSQCTGRQRHQLSDSTSMRKDGQMSRCDLRTDACLLYRGDQWRTSAVFMMSTSFIILPEAMQTSVDLLQSNAGERPAVATLKLM